jgi:hypothetical protein
VKKFVTREVLQDLVLAKASGEWGCESITGVIVERADPSINGRNWNVTHLQNEDLPAAAHTILSIVDLLGREYDLKCD